MKNKVRETMEKKSVQPIVASESKYQISWFKQRTNAVSYPTNKLRKKKSLIIAKGKKNLSLRKEHGNKKMLRCFNQIGM